MNAMRHMWWCFFILLFSAITIKSGIAQVQISGKLLEETENDPIQFATVALYVSNDSSLVTGVLSDAEGEFALEEVSRGNYYLDIRFLGFNNKRIANVEITGNQDIDLGSIAMNPNQTLLDEIIVTGEHTTAMHKADRQVFDASKFQSSKGGTATDVLRNLPSISVNAQGEITARGSSGFVVLIDGKPIQTSASVILNQLPANAIENIEVITAPSAKYDPEGKAGIINITTNKAGASDGLFLQINAKAGLPSIEDYDNAEPAPKYGADVTVNYRKDKWDVSAGASYLRNDITGRRVGDVYTMIADTFTRFPSDGERSFDEINYSGRFTVGYTPNKRNNLSLGFYAGERTKDRTADILYYDNHAIYQGERLYTFQYYNENLRTRRGDFVLGSIDYGHDFKNGASFSTSFLYEYTMLGGPTTNRNLAWPNTSIVYQDEYNTNDNPLHGSRFEADYTSQSFAFGNVAFGYQYRNLDHRGDFVYQRKNSETDVLELVPEFSSSVDLRRQIHSGYAMISGQMGKWEYGAGLRLEHMDRTLDLKDKAGTVDTTYHYDFIKPYPSANVQYSLTERFRFKAAYSKRVERTTTFKMNPFPEREHSETLEQGDPELLPEFIDLVEFGFVHSFGNNSVFATAYYRHVNNLVNRVNNVYNDTILNRIYSSVGVGNSTGLEMGMELKPTEWWRIFAGGNVYNYQIDGTFDDRAVNTSSTVYTINANTTLALPKGFSMQWSLNYISDRNTAQGEDSRYLSPNLTLQKTFLNNKLTATVQWLNMDMGLLNTNEQRITTFREGAFYTTTNYIYEVDVIMINLSYILNRRENKARFIESEFGKKEF